MAAGALDVLVRFVGDASSVSDEVAKVEGTGSKLKTWAKGVGAAIAGAFAVSQLKEFVDQASALQDAQSASEQVFGSSAKAVKAWSDQATDSFGLSKRAAIEANTTFATFGKGAGLAGKDLVGFSTDLTGLAGDLASFRGTSTEQAIGAIGSALQGQSEPMRAYGVLLDEATIKARAMSMGLVQAAGDADKIKAAQLQATTAQEKYNKAVKEHGPNSKEAAAAATRLELAQSKLAEETAGTVPDLTAQQKVLATQAEIFAQTSDAQGDFERTGDSAANQQKKLKAELENTQAAIGTALLPVIQKLLPYLQSMASFVEKNAGWLVPLAAGIMALVLVLKIATVVQTAFSISLWAALWPVLAVIAAIAALIAIGVLIVKNWDTIKDAAAAVWRAMQSAWDAILGAVKSVFDWIKTNWPTLLAILTGPIGLAVLLVTKNLDTIKDALSAVLSWIRTAWSAVLGYLTAPFEAGWKIIQGVVDSIRGVVSSVSEIAGRIANAVKGPVNAVIRAWNRLEFKVPEVNVGPVHFGGQTIGLPNIPELARGGYVARTGLAVVHRGETFSGVGNAGGTVINLNVNVGPGADPAQIGRTLVEYIGAFERANGRQVLNR